MVDLKSMRLSGLVLLVLLLSQTVNAIGPSCPVISSSGPFSLAVDPVGAPNDVSGTLGDPPGTDYACVVIAAPNVVFDCNGHFITGNGTYGTSQYGILLNGSASNVTVRNCPGISNYSGGIYVYGSDNDTLANNTAYGDSAYGIILSSGSNDTIVNNTAYGNAVAGIDLESSPNNLIANNTAYSNGDGWYHGGIILDYSSNNIVANNSAYNNTVDGIFLWGSSGNNLTNNSASSSQYGIFLHVGSNNNIVANNSAYNNTADGFAIDWSSDDNIFTNNSAYNNTQNGIGLDGSTGDHFTDNNLSSNGNAGAYLGSSSGALLDNLFLGNTLQGNANYDVYVAAATDSDCQDNFTGNLGTGNGQILYYNTSVTLAGDSNISELILCNADYSSIDNVSVNSPDSFGNNGILLFRTDFTNISNSNSSENHYGIYLSASDNNIIIDSSGTSDSGTGIYLSIQLQRPARQLNRRDQFRLRHLPGFKPRDQHHRLQRERGHIRLGPVHQFKQQRHGQRLGGERRIVPRHLDRLRGRRPRHGFDRRVRLERRHIRFRHFQQPHQRLQLHLRL